MKALRICIILVFICSVILLAAYTLNGAQLDRTAPVFTMDSAPLRVSVLDGADTLLNGVQALDETDGDVTDRIMLLSVSPLTGYNTAEATLAVTDSSDNMATITRRLVYTDYHLPEFSLSRPLVFAPGDEIILPDVLHAYDCLDGDISGSITLGVDAVTYTQDGEYDISVLVINSRGDGAVLPLKCSINARYAHSQPLRLKAYIAYLDCGAAFDPNTYLDTYRNGSLVIKSDVDTSAPGVYQVQYCYTADDNSTVSLWLTVVVRETEAVG